MKSNLTTIVFGGLLATASARTTQVASPNGNHSLVLSTDGGALAYSIVSEGRPVVEPTPISLTISGETLPGSESSFETTTREVRETTTPVVATFASSFPDSYNEVSLSFDDGISLCARAYDDGVAFRWETRSEGKEVTIDGETMGMTLASDFPVYFPEPLQERFFSHQESNYVRMPASVIDGDKLGPAPLLVDRGDNRWLLLSDVNVENYPGMWITGTGSPRIQAAFAPYPLETSMKDDRSVKVSRAASYIAKTTGTRTYPWRAFVLSDAAGLLTSSLLYNLAEPSRLDDPSWIEPGKVAWDWWNANNIYGVPFRAGINQDTYKYYIDFAAEMGLPYVILDEGWSVPGPDKLLTVVPEIDMQALADYARSKDIRLILWMTSAALERCFDTAFEQFEKWNVAGIKVDFMQRDDQPMMEFLYRAAEEAAKHHMLADFHGGSKPTGLQRTWPNVLTFESVLGLEQNKWGNDANPDMATILPFTRMVVGPMDYTPGAMNNLQKKTFQPMFETPASQGTRAQQLAMYVVFTSPLQMLADTPTNYRRNPECLPFLKKVPVTWDETRVLHAAVGDCVAVARRKDDTWYLGGLGNWQARDVELSLDFLPEGAYQLELWHDGPNADRNGNDLAVETQPIPAERKIKIHFAPGGGFAGIISPRPVH